MTSSYVYNAPNPLTPNQALLKVVNYLHGKDRFGEKKARFSADVPFPFLQLNESVLCTAL